MHADSSATRVTQAAHCVGNASEMLGSSGGAILRTFTRNPDEHTEASPHRALRRRRPLYERLCAGPRRLRRRAVRHAAARRLRCAAFGTGAAAAPADAVVSVIARPPGARRLDLSVRDRAGLELGEREP